MARAKGVRIPKPTAPSKAWLLTFADLISLLITFFVMLYAMKAVDVKKWEEISGSITGAMRIAAPNAPVDMLRDKTTERISIRQADNLDYVQNILRQRLADNFILSQINVVRNIPNNTLDIILPAGVLFNPGSADIRGEAQEALQVLANLLRYLDNQIIVSGHTDPTPIRNAYPSNWELSMARAVSVASVLKSSGVTSAMRIQAYGSSRFDALPSDLSVAEKMFRARRVELSISAKTGEFEER